MKIIIVCQTMTYLSGSPLYSYTLAKELVKEHEVSILSQWADNTLKSDLVACGVKCIGSTDEEYDLALVSQQGFVIPIAKKVINIVHSEYECETPIIDGIDEWIAIRPSIKEHLITEHAISEDKSTVIYNGIDLERFKPVKKQERDYIKVVIPATIDQLREKFLNYYTEKATKDYRVYIFGKDFGARIKTNEFVYISNEINNIQDEIADADIVAGILLGRVNLEARACNVKSFIHNPDNPEQFTEYYPDRQEFENNHDIKNVAKQII